MRTRVALGVLGSAGGLYGTFLMLSRQDPAAWLEVGIWFGAGVVLHDFVLAPLVLLAAVVLVRILPSAARPAAIVGLVVLGTVTLLAVPVLGGFGVKADNPTLFDRNYLLGWVVLALLVGVGAGVGTWLHARQTSQAGGAGHGTRARR